MKPKILRASDLPNDSAVPYGTAKRFHDAHIQLAEQAEAVGDHGMAEHHRKCALTYAHPIGNLIAMTYN